MSTIKPNQLDKITEKGEIPVEKLPETINKSESHLFHVLAIEKTADFEKDKVVYKVRHVKYNQKSYDKTKDILTKSGYHKVVILHDPNVKAQPKKLTANEIIEKINKAETLEDIEPYADSKTKTVKEAYDKKAKELRTNS